MSEALEIYKHLAEMEERARGEVRLAHNQGLPLQEAAATSQVMALAQLRYWLCKRYNIRHCCECGNALQTEGPVDTPVHCPDCQAADGPVTGSELRGRDC